MNSVDHLLPLPAWSIVVLDRAKRHADNATSPHPPGNPRGLGHDLTNLRGTLREVESDVRQAPPRQHHCGDTPAHQAKTLGSRKSAQKFLQAVTARVKQRMPALGLGDELDVSGDDVVGGALPYSARIGHLAAFAEVP